MNGAHALLRTLVDNRVTTCFTNPGTSEMHFVAALDSVPEMRAILALFEGVATGAADGYARMSGRPGATLLLPADVSWSDGAQPAPPPAAPSPPVAADDVVSAVAEALRRGKRTALLLGGRALREPGLLAAARVASATGAQLLSEVFPTR